MGVFDSIYATGGYLKEKIPLYGDIFKLKRELKEMPELPDIIKYEVGKGILYPTDPSELGEEFEEILEVSERELIEEKEEFIREMGYSGCVDKYNEFMERDDAKLLCQRIIAKSTTEEDEKWLIVDLTRLREHIKEHPVDYYGTPVGDIFQKPAPEILKETVVEKTTIIKEAIGDFKMPDFSWLKWALIPLLIILLLLALGYSGIGGIVKREHARRR